MDSINHPTLEVNQSAISKEEVRENANSLLKGLSSNTLDLPEGKKYYRTKEVSSILNIDPHTLRYWQSEFNLVRPRKSKGGQRIYSRKDLKILHQIKHLLHSEKLSIKDAKIKLSEVKAIKELIPQIQNKNEEFLKQIVHDLKEIIQLLKLGT